MASTSLAGATPPGSPRGRRPWPAACLPAIERLGHDIGDAQRAADGGPQPVRRLVVEVVGEPELAAAAPAAAADSAAAAAQPAARQVRRAVLPARIAVPVVAPKAAGQLDLVPEAGEERRAKPAPCGGRPTAPDGPAASSARRTRPASGGLAPRRREAEAPGQPRDPGAKANCSRMRAGPARPMRLPRAPGRGSAPRAHGRGPRDRPAGTARRSRPARPPRDGADLGRDHRQLLRHRLHDHVGQAVAVAVRGDPGGQAEQVGAAQCRQHLLLRARPAPGDPVGDAQPLGRAPRASRASGRRRYARSASAARRGKRASASSRTSRPFFSTARATQTMCTGRCGIAAVAARLAAAAPETRSASRP